MSTENRESCSQRDSAERKGYWFNAGNKAVNIRELHVRCCERGRRLITASYSIDTSGKRPPCPHKRTYLYPVIL